MKISAPEPSFRFLLPYFYKEYLVRLKGLTPNSIASYKDVFRIFIPWLSKNLKKKEPTLKDVQITHIIEFLKYLETERDNKAQTRNQRLAVIKTFFTMCHSLYDDMDKFYEKLCLIPQKKYHEPLIDYFEHDEVIKILNTVDRRHPLGFRDFTILNLLYDTGMRASEIAHLKFEHYQRGNNALEILGKGHRYRCISIWPKNAYLLNIYLDRKRKIPKPQFKDYLFVNQQGEPLTRFGINKISKKYIAKVPDLKKRFVSAKRQPAHSWRHTAAMAMLNLGYTIEEVQRRLGHKSSHTTINKYLKINLETKEARIKELIRYSQNIIGEGIQAPLDWSNEKEVLEYLKNL